MDFVDRTFLRLANPALRGGLFDAEALAQLIATAYDAERLAVEEPLDPVFDEVRLGYVATGPVIVEGGWTALAGHERTEARLLVSSLFAAPARVDALWRGAILARVKAGVDRVERVDTAWSDQREATVTLTFEAGDPPHADLVALPMVVALLVRDAGFGVAELVAETHAVRERLEGLGLERPRDERLPLRNSLVVAWVVPEATFEDDAWPGADGAGDPAEQRRRRRAMAGRWLAREGIGLVVA